MEDNEKDFKLLICNSYSEKNFISNYGQELYNILSDAAFKEHKWHCAGCGHLVPEYKRLQNLKLHIYDVNTTNPELSKGVPLCNFCHYTQHIEIPAKNNWIELINSVYSQTNLIRLMRGDKIYPNLNNRTIIKLKKTPQELLNEIHNGTFQLSNTLKIIFTDKVSFDDMY